MSKRSLTFDDIEAVQKMFQEQPLPVHVYLDRIKELEDENEELFK